MSTTFVLMPLSKEFDPVYSDFIKPVLEDAGFDVLRANDIRSTQNVMRDIFEAITKSDLIVADLTGSNPNVFYELGIAHALKRPVILLTQIIDDVPFDLRTYRLIEYNTYFTEIGKAKQILADYATKFRDGVLPTRDPVTDFFPDGYSPILANDAETGAGGPVNAEAPGFLDSLVETEDHFNAMAEIVRRLDSSLTDMTNGLTEATGNLDRINANPNQSSAKAAQNVCRRLGTKIGAFNDVLEPANVEFAEVVNEAQETVAAVLSFQGEHIESTSSQVAEQRESLQALAEQRESLQALVDSGTGALDALNYLVSGFEAFPRMERRLEKEVQIGINGLHNMVGSLSRLVLWGSAAVDKMDAMMERQKEENPG